MRNSNAATSFIIKVKVFASTDFSKILACSAPLKFQLLEAIIQLPLKYLPHLRSHWTGANIGFSTEAFSIQVSIVHVVHTSQKYIFSLYSTTFKFYFKHKHILVSTDYNILWDDLPIFIEILLEGMSTLTFKSTLCAIKSIVANIKSKKLYWEYTCLSTKSEQNKTERYSYY